MLRIRYDVIHLQLERIWMYALTNAACFLTTRSSIFRTAQLRDVRLRRHDITLPHILVLILISAIPRRSPITPSSSSDDSPFCTRICAAVVFGFAFAAASSFFFIDQICGSSNVRPRHCRMRSKRTLIMLDDGFSV